jgi:hydroxypyruvate reductase
MSLERLRRDADSIFRAGVKAVDTSAAVKRFFSLQNNTLKIADQIYDLSEYKRIYVIGAGKASAAMARPVEEQMGDRITGGIIQVKYGHSVPLSRIQVREAGHPIPDENGLSGSLAILDLLENTKKNDLVLFLISGGGSALLPMPAPGLTLEDKQTTTKLMLDSGARIHEMNAVRKHISGIKGGRLAQRAFPSTLISLILSDVIGDSLDIIASGPTVADTSTFKDCLQILEKYGLRNKIPSSVLELIEKGMRGEAEETPKKGDPVFQNTQNVIIGSNIIAAKAAEEKAKELGYNATILSTTIDGETKEAAKDHATLAKMILESGTPVEKPACVVSGGETTVTIRGNGLGGRNQEFVLAAALQIEGLENVVILSCGTDGTDGPTDAAGAVADGRTVQRAKALGIDAEGYLRENDSYHFFEPLNDLIITGPTFTNVMDLRLVMVDK